MTDMDYSALRRKAEAANKRDCWLFDEKAFRNAATPAIVLALLDELAALRARLADGERQEPVAHCYKGHGGTMRAYWGEKVHVDHKPLFTAPPTAATIRQQALEECKEAARAVIENTDIAIVSEGPAILAAIRKLAQEGDK